MRALCIRHAHTGCLHPRAHPADASAAWRPSPHMAVEPRPDPGALTGAAAGPAGRAVETPYATIAAALSRASGIGAGNPGGPPCRATWRQSKPAAISGAQPNDPAAWGYAARSPTAGKSGGPPRHRDQIRPPQGPVSACKLPGKLVRAALNLFHSAQTKSCLGHCITRGIGLRRQATILRLRGAVLFSRAEARPALEFGRARGVETLIARRFCRAFARRRCLFSMEP